MISGEAFFGAVTVSFLFVFAVGVFTLYEDQKGRSTKWVARLFFLLLVLWDSLMIVGLVATSLVDMMGP